MRPVLPVARGSVFLLGLLTVVVGMTTPARAGELTADEAARMMLNSARRAYNEQKYRFAADRFREFLKRYGGHREAPAAHYGLALALLEGPTKDYQGAIDALRQVVGRQDSPDRPFALFYTGFAQRRLGDQALAQAKAKPNEAQRHYNTARQRFEEAARSFSDAAAAFMARVKTSAVPPAAPSTASGELLGWAARARCDQCEMLLRLKRFKEARKLAEAFLADPLMGKSRYRPLAGYHLGYACFALRDYLAAGRALSRLAPFQQEFGVHARYLLARTHHLSDERPEAAAQYKAVLAGYEERKKAAQEALRNPGALKPEHRARLESLVRSAPPDYLLRVSFYLALLACEEGRFADALAGFSTLIQRHPRASFIPQAQLRVGFCQMQSGKSGEAIRTLQPLCKHPQLADQAMWWLARAQVRGADPKNAQAYAQALRTAMDGLRRAADRAGQLARTDPDAKIRRGDILLELADTMQRAKQYREAAAMYQTVLNEKNNPDRAAEAMQRQVTALHLAGMLRESNELCERFERTYPKSTLLPAVWFRRAENAYVAATTAAKDPNLRNRQQELERRFGEAIARYQRLVTRFPEFAYVGLARERIASAYYRLGRYKDAIAILSAIPEADRHGALATVDYLLADCLLRTFPSEADDALQAALLVDRAGQVVKLLEGFVAAQGKGPQVPDALLKLGHCYQRIAGVLADPGERKKKLTLARGAYERFLQQFRKDPSVPMAAFERAKCLALLGDVGGATGELNRFQRDPFGRSPIAPLALLRLSTLLRAQKKPADAANVMKQCRARHEGNLLRDPARKGWVPMLQYEHALAIKESGKLAEARTMFDALAKQFAAHPEAMNALWRGGQCRREELMAALAAARQALARAGAGSREAQAAKQAIDKSLKSLRQTVQSLQDRADELGKKAARLEPHLRMLYEVAWCYRVLADADIEAARQKLQRQALEEVRAKLAKQMPPGQAPPALRAPEIPLSAISIRLTERAAHAHYKRLIAAAPAAALAIRARLELAEMYAQRANHVAALELLAKALEKDPPPELAEQIRLRLAEALLARNDVKSALPHVQAVVKNADSPLAAQARYLAGEVCVQQQDWAKAIKQLLPFRDHGPLQNIPGISDRALLALGQAYASAGQWDASRHTLSTLAQRFRQSPWVDEALYRIGWSWESQKQYDNAVNAYSQVTRRTASEWAAKAQLQIGLCRLQQRRYPEAAQALLVVPFTYDYPECSAAAWCEAARAYKEMKQPDEAAKLWRRVIKDYPASRWAQVARQRLAEIKETVGP